MGKRALPLKRRCPHCGKPKLLSHFYTQGKRTGAGHRHGWCKACRCADEKRRRQDPALIAKFKRRYETDMAFRARERMRHVAKRCRRLGIAFDLDDQWLEKRLLAGACELTGIPFNMAATSRRPEMFGPSIDRKRPELGYTKGNCRLVLFAINLALNTWGLEAFLPVAKALADRHYR